MPTSAPHIPAFVHHQRNPNISSHTLDLWQQGEKIKQKALCFVLSLPLPLTSDHAHRHSQGRRGNRELTSSEHCLLRNARIFCGLTAFLFSKTGAVRLWACVPGLDAACSVKHRVSAMPESLEHYQALSFLCANHCVVYSAKKMNEIASLQPWQRWQTHKPKEKQVLKVPVYLGAERAGGCGRTQFSWGNQERLSESLL